MREDTLALLRIAPFRVVWSVRVAWTLGIQMLLVTIAWQMYELTRDPWSLALVGLYQFVPVLLLTLPAGQVADRGSRAKILAFSLLVQGLVAALLALATWQGTVQGGHLLAASLLLGAARAFLMPSLQAITPTTVPQALLARAMAASAMGTQGSVVLGPALGGMLMLLGTGVVYACAALLLGAGILLALRLPSVRPATVRDASWRTLFSGVHFVLRRPIILGAITLDLFAVLFGGAVALLPVYAREILHGGPAMLGWLRAAPAMGALLMSLHLLRHPPATHVGRRLLGSVAVFGLATIVFGLSESFAVSMLALMVNGAADMVSVVIRQTLVQLDTPDEMRGRVSAVNAVFIGASNQLGEFQAGAAATLIGPVAAVVLGGTVTCAAAAAWPKLFPALSRRRALQA